MQQNLSDTISLLSRTPATLNALLRDLPESWALADEGEGSWNIHAILGHLVHGERTDWLPRVKIILEHGDTLTFPAFNRQAAESRAPTTVPHLLDEFTELRTASLIELNALDLQPSDMDRRGLHPAFGKVTLSQLLATWATHDLTHLHQISRVLAHQYREAVGPWSAYLGVLHCTGHGS